MTEAEAKSILTQWHMWWGEGLEQLYEISCTIDYQGLYPDEVAHQYDYIPGEQIEAAQAAQERLEAAEIGEEEREENIAELERLRKATADCAFQLALARREAAGALRGARALRDASPSGR